MLISRKKSSAPKLFATTVGLTLLLVSSLWSKNDEPINIHFRAGYFATPIEIEGDERGRKISSMEIICESLHKSGGEGILLINESQLEFNDFGDASCVKKGPIRKHRVSLERVALTGRFGGAESPNRAIYKIVLEQSFCNRWFYLNLSRDSVRPNRLLVCDADPPRPLKGSHQTGPRIVKIFHLTSPDVPGKIQGDELVGDTISMGTPTVNFARDGFTGSFSIVGKLGGNGRIVNDLNRTFVDNYGDSISQTTFAYPSSRVELVEKDIIDPRKTGRRIFDIEGQLLSLRQRAPDAPKNTYSVVLSPMQSGSHRLIIKRDGTIVHVIPISDIQWQRYALRLESLSDGLPKSTVEELRRLAGNAFSFEMDQGFVAKVSLSGEVNDEMLQLIAQLEDLSVLRLIGCRGFTASGFESISRLKSLASISVRNTLTTDGFLQMAGQLPMLRVLTIHHDPNQLNALNQTTDSGVAYLASAKELHFLKLSGEGIGDDSVSTLVKHKQLESLLLYTTKFTLAGLTALSRALPGCSINCDYQGSNESFHRITISKGGTEVSISGQISEQEFHVLKGLENLEKLRLSKLATDQTLKTVSQIDGLRSIGLRNNRQITDKGIVDLKAIDGLRELSLWNCENLTDDCSAHLGQLKQLESLNLIGTKLTATGIQRLRTELPNCKIKYR